MHVLLLLIIENPWNIVMLKTLHNAVWFVEDILCDCKAALNDATTFNLKVLELKCK